MSPEHAKKLLDSTPYRYQRGLRPTHIARLAHAMREGTFKASSIEVVECEESHWSYLVDGQHRLQAILDCKIPQLLILVEWRVDTLVEVDQLYATTDSGRARTLKDRIHALDHDISARDAALISGAVIFAEMGWRRALGEADSAIRFDANERAKRARLWTTEFEQIEESLSGASPLIKSACRREPILAVLLQAQRFQPELTAKFLIAIAENDRLEKNGAAWHFVNTLAPRSVGLNQSVTYSRWMASIWNAHFMGKLLPKLLARDPKQPFLLEGTPFNGKNNRHIVP